MRVSQGVLNPPCERMRAAENAPRNPFRGLERRHGLTDIVECGTGSDIVERGTGSDIVERCTGFQEERPRASPIHSERECITLSENAPRHGYTSST